MGKVIKYLIKNVSEKIQDILILGGLGLFILTMFKYVSVFAGSISLSIVLIILGVALSKIKSEE